MDKYLIFNLILNRLPGIGIVGINKIINKLSSDMTNEELLYNLNSLGFNLITVNDLNLAYENAIKTIELCEKNEINILFGDKIPINLRGYKDSPIIIFGKGKEITAEELYVGVIGTRNPSDYGIMATKTISDHLYKKTSFYILSGLALGVDSIAHASAVNNNSRTLAVIGSGILNIYPRENISLANNIYESGGYILSPFFPLDSVEKYKLIYRDKLQARLSNLIVLIESKIDGGSMHAVNEAFKLKKSICVIDYSKTKIKEDLYAGNKKAVEENGAFLVDLDQFDSILSDDSLKKLCTSLNFKNSTADLF